MALQLPIQGTTIVLRGDLNPAIFQPSWFALQGLLRAQEAEAAKIQIIHADAAVFTTEWLDINVVRDRFQASTMQEAFYEPLRDLIVGVLALLSHTPIKVMGINRLFHYRLESQTIRNDVGHQLVPIHIWESVLDKPGMASVTVQGMRPNDTGGYTRAKVEPSSLIEYGIYCEVNDHYEFKRDGHDLPGAQGAIRVLTERWQESMDRSLAIAQKIANLGESGCLP